MTSTFTEPFPYVTAADIKPTAFANFPKHIEITDEFYDETPCLRWTGALNKAGYGKFQSGADQYAHRFAWLSNFGWIPKGRRFDIAHQCHHRWCVQYAHLELEPRHRNMNDLIVHQRDTCKDGHPKAEFGRLDKRGRWVCRECTRIAVAAYYATHPE